MKNKLTKLTTTAMFMASAAIYAQTGAMGINTSTPKTTLDITGKLGATDADGLQAPRLTRAQLTTKGTLYTAAQTGAIVYITDITGGDTTEPRQNIAGTGYYYFDGTLWQGLKDPRPELFSQSFSNRNPNTISITVPDQGGKSFYTGNSITFPTTGTWLVYGSESIVIQNLGGGNMTGEWMLIFGLLRPIPELQAN